MRLVAYRRALGFRRMAKGKRLAVRQVDVIKCEHLTVLNQPCA
jgi:hypothetical protein